jgi:hypothetical protein
MNSKLKRYYDEIIMMTGSCDVLNTVFHSRNKIMRQGGSRRD